LADYRDGFAATVRCVIRCGGCNCSRANWVGACLGAIHGIDGTTQTLFFLSLLSFQVHVIFLYIYIIFNFSGHVSWIVYEWPIILTGAAIFVGVVVVAVVVVADIMGVFMMSIRIRVLVFSFFFFFLKRMIPGIPLSWLERTQRAIDVLQLCLEKMC
jgi:hypothetical protein